MANLNKPLWQQANPSTGESTQRIAPNSSYIEAAEYNSTDYSLTIHFKKGGEVKHLLVYPIEWQQGLGSQSFGSWYSRNIKGKKMSAKIINKNTGKEKHNG
jgi:hypothetical protein